MLRYLRAQARRRRNVFSTIMCSDRGERCGAGMDGLGSAFTRAVASLDASAANLGGFPQTAGGEIAFQ